MPREYFTYAIKNQEGSALIAVVFLLMLIAMMSITMLTITVSDTRMGMLRAEQVRAFYAAQSGLEYGIKRVLLSAPDQLHGWSEEINTGNGTTCKVQVVFLGNNRFQVRANGYSQKFVKKLSQTLSYIDVSRYAIYTTGNVSRVVAHPWPPHGFFFISHYPSLVYAHAPVMPKFDLDELRQLSLPNGYHSGNYVVNSIFHFPPNKFVFVERNLTFQHWNWFGWGHFVARGWVKFKSPWLPFSATFGTVYQPTPGKRLTSQISLFRRSLIGGVISNGNVRGAPWLFGSSNLYVFHHRNTMIRFLRHSVNESPLVFRQSRWENLN